MMAINANLYEAATNSLASDASRDNCWSAMVKASLDISVDQFRNELLITEKDIKEQYKLKKMPDAWRSAKSVVLGALTRAISLVNENKEIYGKTDIQAKIKEFDYKDLFKSKSDLAVCLDFVKRMSVYWNKLSTSEKTIVTETMNKVLE